MIKEDFEVKKNLIFINNDCPFILIDYIYLILSQEIKNSKKLILLSLLFTTLQISNKNIYSLNSLKHLQKLNKNGFFIDDNNYNINNNYDISKINGTNNKYIFNENSLNNNININETKLNISNYSNETNNINISKGLNLNYSRIKNDLFWRNESVNLKEIKEEILKYKCHCFKISFEKKEDFYKRNNPKISLIITIYNQKEFIKMMYTCIQNQSIKDIEIIFVDDASTDGSKRIIKLLMKKDKRIIYIKNTINKGQYYSRYKGILSAKGKYIAIIDPDDLLLNDIITKAYILANYYKLDIVHYYHMKGNFTENKFIKLNISGIFYNYTIIKLYYNCLYRYLWDKLILRKIYLKSIKFIKEKYRNSRIIIHNDEVACYAVFRVANSYGILEQVGYFYNRENKKSITKQNFKPENINGRFYSLFTIMEYYFKQSYNDSFEKTNGGYNFFKLKIDYLYRGKIKYLTDGFIYINNTLNLYLKSKFFNKTQRIELKRFRKRINKQYMLILNLNNNNKSFFK